MPTDQPTIPARARTIAYVALVVAAAVELFTVTTAAVLFGEASPAIITVVSAGSAAVALVAGAFGVYYRPTGPHATGP